MSEVIQYRTSGTCCALMQVEIDNEIIKNVQFLGGCNGNLQGIRNLIIDMNINDVISKLKGIRCGDKDTSCPDQLAKCLVSYLEKKSVKSI